MGKRKQQTIVDDWDRASTAQRSSMIFNAISDGKMDQEKIKRLLEVADQQDQIKLKVLHNAVIKCLKDYQADPTSAHLNDWQKAEHALETFVVELCGKHFQEEKTFPNILAVVDYLSVRGWKIGQRAVYNHRKEGKIRPQPDGSFRVADIERYAEIYLKRKDGSESGKLDKLQQGKLIAETRKSAAQAEHWETKTQVFTGQFVPKDFFERELAKRASVFRSDLEGFARAAPAGIIHLVEGDAGQISDLIAYLLVKVDDFLDRYAEEKEFTIPSPAVAGPDLTADIIDEDIEEE